MPFDAEKYHRVCVDLTEKEFIRLRAKTERLGATYAGYMRNLLKKDTKDIPIPDTQSQIRNHQGS